MFGLVFVLSACSQASASSVGLKLPSFLSDNMVLQRGGAALWGWAPAGATIRVAVRDSHTGTPLTDATAVAEGDDGRWTATLKLTATPNTTITVTSGNGANSTATLRNVAFGDVYLCGGQSNMEYPMADVFNGAEEREASFNPMLRMLNFQDISTPSSSSDCPSKAPYIWAASAPATISPRSAASDPDKGGFADKYPSAVCWFAARGILEANPGVALGIITAAKSGSAIECWMPPAAITDGIPPSLGGNGTCGGTLKPARAGIAAAETVNVLDGYDNDDNGAVTIQESEADSTCPRNGIAKSGGYFNGMIAPLLPMRLTAVLWYQGEANDVGKADACAGPAFYKCLFPAMIQYWRDEFKHPNLPFIYCLLAGGHSAVLREAQAVGAGALERTMFASAVDLSAATNEYLVAGHPPRKQELGRRVALVARRLVYNQTVVDDQGPRVLSAAVAQAAAGGATTVTLTFDVGTNGQLHQNGTGGCTACCNASDVFKRADYVGLVDPDRVVPAGGAPVVTKATTVKINGGTAGGAATVVAVVAAGGWNATKGRAEVQFLFDNHPECALYNGILSGPDSYYAATPHYGIVAQSWRGIVSVSEE